MKKPFIAMLLACFMVCLAEGPWAWAQTQPAQAPSEPDPRGLAGAVRRAAAAQQPAPIQAPPAPSQPAPGAPPAAPTGENAAQPAPPPAAPTPAPPPGPTPAPAPPTFAPAQPTPTQTPPANGADANRRRPGDLIRPALRRTSRTTRPAAARPATSPATPGAAAPAPAQTGSPTPATGSSAVGTPVPGTSGSAPVSPSTPNVSLPSANAEGVMELPGEKEFNQCKRVPSGKRILKFSFKPETEITDLIGWISAISCTQFLIGGTPVAGKKVTVMSPQLISLEEAYRLFLGALESVQLTVEPMGKFLRIVDTSRARFSNLPFQKNGQTDPLQSDKRYVTRLFRFDHLDPNEVMNLYNQVRGEQGIAVAFQGSLIITDQSVMLDRFGEIIRELDQPSVIKEKIWMIRVRNTSATEMAGRLAEIFAVQQMGMGGRRPGGPGAPMAPPPPAPGARGPQTVKRVDLASQLSITKLIPDERSNQLIVVANEQAYEWLLTIMKKLDVPIEGGGDGRFHIYYCEHANCDELAATLSAVTGVSVIGGGGARRTSRTAVPGAPQPMAPTPSPIPGQGQQPSQLFEGDVRVTFDAATNSLVVNSSLKDFQSLRRVIEKLDGPRKQVYVEAMILEVLLDKSRDMGVAYHGGKSVSVDGRDSVLLGGFDAGKTLNPASLAGDLVGLAGAVFGPALEASTSRLFGTQVDIPSFGAFIKLLQKNNDVNVLSTPHLLITNNQEGEISVGQRLPFPGGFLGGFGGGGGLPGQQGGLGGIGGLLGGTAVTREDVSLRMKLIPSVNEYNMIRLDVDVEISDLASPNFNGLGPATTKRTAKTPVVCKDQQTVIIGGLMSDRQSDTVSKIPVLGDIPVLGFFFRSTSKQLVKSNIIIALTPYVITDMEDLRRVAEKKMRERREFIERFSAVEDKADFDAAIDYRRKRGMLEEINRASREIDDEEAALRVIRERELQDESTPIEPPGQNRPRAGEPAVPPTSSKQPTPAAPAPAAPPTPETPAEQPPAVVKPVGEIPVKPAVAPAPAAKKSSPAVRPVRSGHKPIARRRKR
jgi:general secretion pathway protein D